MTTVVPPPCDRFYNNLMCIKPPILQALSQSKGTQSSLVNSEVVEAAFLLLAYAGRQELLDTFIERTHTHWELIASSKDVSPIIDTILGGFQELGSDRITEIKRIVKEKEVDPEIQFKVFNIGKSLVKIAIRHLQAVGSETIDIQKMARLYDLDTGRK